METPKDKIRTSSAKRCRNLEHEENFINTKIYHINTFDKIYNAKQGHHLQIITKIHIFNKQS